MRERALERAAAPSIICVARLGFGAGMALMGTCKESQGVVTVALGGAQVEIHTLTLPRKLTVLGHPNGS